MNKKKVIKWVAVAVIAIITALVLNHDIHNNSLSWQLLLPLIIALVAAFGWESGDTADTNSAEPAYDPQTGSLKERLRRVKATRWVRFGIVSALFFAWVVWLGNPWVLPAWFLLADIYLTQFIPWTWWRGVKNTAVRTVMGWVDAIVYALVLVYFLFLFVGQNYQIPSSSLEKTLLTGDFLWVNKMVYGPRVPQTPLHFPLAQNTLPWLNCKSYIEFPQLSYHRLKGMRDIRRGDIVVFNVPSGDTVAVNCPNPDYYTLCYEAGLHTVVDPDNAPLETIKQAGREYLAAHEGEFGKVITRPVDRRDNYVKRCVGLPGESLSVLDGTVVIDGRAITEPANVQYMYYVETTAAIDDATFDRMGIAIDDRHAAEGGYLMPLTSTMVEQLKSLPVVTGVQRARAGEGDMLLTYPIGYNYGWTHLDYGPVTIPKRGMTVSLDETTLPLYERCIRAYEGNTLERTGDGSILINGERVTSYTFKMNYYWMMGDNRDNSLDSRYWGFVPEDHIVGTPMVVLVSFDKDKPMNHGGLRWDRVFITPNPDTLEQ